MFAIMNFIYGITIKGKDFNKLVFDNGIRLAKYSNRDDTFKRYLFSQDLDNPYKNKYNPYKDQMNNYRDRMNMEYITSDDIHFTEFIPSRTWSINTGFLLYWKRNIIVPDNAIVHIGREVFTLNNIILSPRVPIWRK